MSTIGMRVRRSSALVTLTDDVVGDTFTHTVIKNEVFTKEFNRKTFFFSLLGIIDDAAIQLIDIFKTVVS